MSTLQRIHQNINAHHTAVLNEVGKNVGNALNVAPLATELSDLLSAQGISTTIHIGFVPTLIMDLPESSEPRMEQIWQVLHDAGFDEWRKTKNLEAHGINSQHGFGVRISLDADPIGRGEIKLDITGYKK